MNFLSLKNAVSAKAILLSISLVVSGIELPRYTKLLTFSRSSPWIKMLSFDRAGLYICRNLFSCLISSMIVVVLKLLLEVYQNLMLEVLSHLRI